MTRDDWTTAFAVAYLASRAAAHRAAFGAPALDRGDIDEVRAVAEAAFEAWHAEKRPATSAARSRVR